MLAHYHELDFAMSYNVQPNLLRIAVGLEDLDELKNKFSNAFQRSKLHPRLPASFSSRGFCTDSMSLESDSSRMGTSRYPSTISLWRRQSGSLFCTNSSYLLHSTISSRNHLKRSYCNAVIKQISWEKGMNKAPCGIMNHRSLWQLLKRGIVR